MVKTFFQNKPEFMGNGSQKQKWMSLCKSASGKSDMGLYRRLAIMTISAFETAPIRCAFNG